MFEVLVSKVLVSKVLFSKVLVPKVLKACIYTKAVNKAVAASPDNKANVH